MGAEKLNHSLETLQQTNDSCQDFGDEADEETLSLCDLVISSDANEYWNDDFYKEDYHSNGDFFEFFNGGFPAAAPSTYPEGNNNIIFCGKHIPFKDQDPNVDVKSQSLKFRSVKQENYGKKNNRSRNFPWKMSDSFNKSRTFPSSSAKGSKSFKKSLTLPAVGSINNHAKYGSNQSKKLGDEKFDFSVKKASVSATPVKSRWYLFAFGVGRFPMEIELKDMKLRQSRKSKAMKFQVPEGGELQTVKGGKERRRSGKGLWRMLNVLGWKSKHTNSAVAQDCNPHE